MKVMIIFNFLDSLQILTSDFAFAKFANPYNYNLSIIITIIVYMTTMMIDLPIHPPCRIVVGPPSNQDNGVSCLWNPACTVDTVF